jgi:hypothetical protein
MEDMEKRDGEIVAVRRAWMPPEVQEIELTAASFGGDIGGGDVSYGSC